MKPALTPLLACVAAGLLAAPAAHADAVADAPYSFLRPHHGLTVSDARIVDTPPPDDDRVAALLPPRGTHASTPELLDTFAATHLLSAPHKQAFAGQAPRRAEMVVPIRGARLSSTFGSRAHPIRKARDSHNGMDFAAPTGTPVLAAAGGVVAVAAYDKRGYGRYLIVEHGNGMATVYAHMSRYAKGIRKGARVKAGEPIGAVGSTGLSTGPHLHFEVRRRGTPVDPALYLTPSRGINRAQTG